MILFTLLLINLLLLGLSEFRSSWCKFYFKVIEYNSYEDIASKIFFSITALMIASLLAPFVTLFELTKKQWSEPIISDDETHKTYQEFGNELIGVFYTDYDHSDELKNLIREVCWLNGYVVVKFHQRPEKSELKDLLDRFRSYSLTGWKIKDFSDLYFYDSYWMVALILIDLVQENRYRQIVEMAKVEREREVDSITIKVKEETKKLKENYSYKKEHDMLLPLWYDRQGKQVDVPLKSHALLIGSTGSGKTQALVYWTWLVNTLKKPGDEFYILDYKKGKDWEPFWKYNFVYGYHEHAKILFNALYYDFERYLKGEANMGDKVIYIFIDELSSFVESFDGKEREWFLKELRNMLRLSRNLGSGNGGYRLIVGMQQADSKYFGGTEGRGNFGVKVALGGMTSEGSRMIFEVTDKSEKPISSDVGKGYAQIYGEPIQKIVMPLVEDKAEYLQDFADKLLD